MFEKRLFRMVPVALGVVVACLFMFATVGATPDLDEAAVSPSRAEPAVEGENPDLGSSPVAEFGTKTPPPPPRKGDPGGNTTQGWGECMDGCQDDYDAGCQSGGGSCDCGDSSQQCQDDLEYDANNCENDCGETWL